MILDLLASVKKGVTEEKLPEQSKLMQHLNRALRRGVIAKNLMDEQLVIKKKVANP